MAAAPGVSAAAGTTLPPELAEARRALQELRTLASSCKAAHLRDEGASIAQAAHTVLDSIGERARRGGVAPEAVARAASKAHAALACVQGRLVTASREFKGGLLGNLKAQLDTSHKKSLRRAREQLEEALQELDAAPDAAAAADAQPSASAAAAGQQQQQQQQQQQAGGGQLHLKWERGTHVTGLGLLPAASPGAGPDLWVGLTKHTEFYPACSTAHKTKMPAAKGQAVTCVLFDAATKFTWTGHADGTVMLQANGAWQAAVSPTQLGVPVRCLAVDTRHNCWAGDDAGVLRVLHHDLHTQRLVVRFQDTPPAIGPFWQLASVQGPAAAAAAIAAASSTSASSSGPVVAPVLAAASRAAAVVSSGGHGRNFITLWNAQRLEAVERCSTETYGAAHSLADIEWPEEGGPAADAVSSSGSGGGGVAPGLAAQHSSSTMSSSEANRGPADKRGFSGWRLLSGHERGQVVLWRIAGVTRQPGVRALQLLSVVGEPRQGCAIRSICTFPGLAMLVLADSSGIISVLPTPSEVNGAVPPPRGGAPGSALPLRPGAPGGGVHVWQQQAARIRAHKAGILAAASQGELLVTASSATVKSWTADQLKLEAQGDGLMFARRSTSTSSGGGGLAFSALSGSITSHSSSAVAGQDLQRQPDRPTPGIGAAVAARSLSGSTDPEGLGSHGGWGTAAAAAAGSPGGTLPSSTGPGGASSDGGDSRGSTSMAQQQAAAAAGDISSGASLPGPVLPGSSQTSAASRVPAVCSQPNPFSKSAAQARGMVLDASNRVVPLAEQRRQLAEQQQQAAWSSMMPSMRALSGPQFAGPSLGGPNPFTQQPGAPGSGGLANASGAAAAAGPGSGSAGAAGAAADTALAESGSVKPSNAIRSEHVICASELMLKEVIGAGAEGKVYCGTWTNIDIAAKEYLAVDDGETQQQGQPSEAAMARARDALIKEVALLTSLNHPNLVRFCGVCLDPPLVVMEYYRHGSVYTLLEKARHAAASAAAAAAGPARHPNKYVSYLGWDRRLEMLHDVASGMMYLHRSRYVHGDLRSPNLFVGIDGRVKIGDFGFTKRLSRSKASLKVRRVTHPRWVAPELMSASRLSAASDVYSFGIIMYELLTWTVPFVEWGKEQVVLKVLQGHRPTIPDESELPPGTSSSTCLLTYIRLMEECWAQEASDRPAFLTIARRLKAMQRWRLVMSKHEKLRSTVLALQQSSSSSGSGAGGGSSSSRGAAAGTKPATAARPAAAAAATAATAAAATRRAPSAAASGQASLGRGSSAAAASAAVAASCDDDDEVLPLPEFPDDAGAGPRALGHTPPSIQAGKVGGTPIICIGLAPGQSGGARSEQQLLAEVQGMRLGSDGQAGAAGGEEPQVLLVGADLPGTPPSSKSELSGLAMQLSGGSATTTTSTIPGGQPAAAAVLPLQDEPLPVRTASYVSGHFAAAGAEAGGGTQLEPTAAAAAAGSMPLPAIAESGEGLAALMQQHMLPAAAADVAAGAAAGAGLEGLRTIKARPDAAVGSHAPSLAEQQQQQVVCGATSQHLETHREASLTDTKDRVQDWLQAAPRGGSEASSMQQPGLIEAAMAADSLAQQQQQQQPAEAGALPAAEAQQQQQGQQQQQEVFTAQDSPFCLVLPSAASSGSVELPAGFTSPSAYRGMGWGTTAGGGDDMAVSSPLGGFGGAAGNLSLMDVYLDDSELPAADASGLQLSEASVIYYPENRTPAEAIIASSAVSVRSGGSISSGGAPTLWNIGFAPGSQQESSASGSAGARSRAPPGSSGDSQPVSFTATERSPFAARLAAWADEGASSTAAPAAVAGGSSGGHQQLPQRDSAAVSAGPFGRAMSGEGSGAGGGSTARHHALLPTINSATEGFGAFGAGSAAAAGGAGGLRPHPQQLQARDSAAVSVGPFGSTLPRVQHFANDDDAAAPPLEGDGTGGLMAATTAAAAAASGQLPAGGAGRLTPQPRPSPPPSPQHRGPLDESVLNQNLEKALGRTVTADTSMEAELDVVDEQERMLQAWQLHDKPGVGGRRASNSSNAAAAVAASAAAGAATAGGSRQSAAGTAASPPPPPPPPGAAAAGLLQMPVPGGGGADGLAGWGTALPSMMSYADPAAAAAAAAAAQMPMQGWVGDGAIVGSIATRGRMPSGVDSTAAMRAWLPGSSPPAPGAGVFGGGQHAGGSGSPFSQGGGYHPAAAAAAAAAGVGSKVTVINPSASAVPSAALYMQQLQLQQQQAMATAAAQQAGAGGWFAAMRVPSAGGMYGPGGQQQPTPAVSSAIHGVFPVAPMQPPPGAGQVGFTPDVSVTRIAMLSDPGRHRPSADAADALSRACLGGGEVPALPPPYHQQQAAAAAAAHHQHHQQQQQQHHQQQQQHAYQHMYNQQQQQHVWRGAP